ncbi:hypothetical protein TrST_g8755 [Triparma strigata]|uniref:mitogen-activated protein kinase kinase n=1 Tax=Triparma strigata TaxID=1606541 RepID=A0A9W7A2R3_9STRA|nr:hypothetical protein TrST_g8755 [Triparma strigata]
MTSRSPSNSKPTTDVEQWLVRLRFNPNESTTYASNLRAQGFDDIQAICEDAELDDFHSAGMLPGHARRLYKAAGFARDYLHRTPQGSPNTDPYNSNIPIPRPHSSSDSPYVDGRDDRSSPFYAISVGDQSRTRGKFRNRSSSFESSNPRHTNTSSSSTTSNLNNVITCPDCHFRFYAPPQSTSSAPYANTISKMTATTISATSGTRSPDPHSYHTPSPPSIHSNPNLNLNRNRTPDTPDTVSTDVGIETHEDVSPEQAPLATEQAKAKATASTLPVSQWTVADVVSWVTSFEAFVKDEVVESLVKLNMDGRQLMNSPPVETAISIGLTFGPHKRLFISEVEALLVANEVPIPTPTNVNVNVNANVNANVNTTANPSPRSTTSPRSETARAAAASRRRKKSKSPINRIGSFHSVTSDAQSNDELSVASGLEDSGDFSSKKKKRQPRSKAKPFSKGAAKNLKGFQPPRLNLDTSAGPKNKNVPPSLRIEMDSIQETNGTNTHTPAEGRIAKECSYEFSDGGTLLVGGFNINPKGIAEVPFDAINEEDGGDGIIEDESDTDEEAGEILPAKLTPGSTRSRKSSGRSSAGNRRPSASRERPMSALRTPRNIQSEIIMLKEVGRGACGIVHEALHVPTMRLVAVKSVPVGDAEKRRQMTSELATMHNMCSGSLTSSAATTTTHPHIVSFYDAFTDPKKGCVCMVLEYMNAGTLQDLVSAEIAVTERMLASVANSVLKGLESVHAGKQIHRDIKPSNILLSRDGSIKISDFGIARKLEHSISMASTFTGTLTYMSPERISGQEYSYPSDIWSLGVCLATIALGKYPFPTSSGYWGVVQAIQDSPPPAVPGFSASMQDFLNACLSKDPKERPSASQLLQHDFVAKYANSPLAAEEEPTLDSKKRKTLTSLAQTVMDFYCDRALSSRANVNIGEGSDGPRQGLEHFVPPMTSNLLSDLAGQLGMPLSALEQVFGEEAEKARVHLGGSQSGGIRSTSERQFVPMPKMLQKKPKLKKSTSGNLVPVKVSKAGLAKLRRGRSDGDREEYEHEHQHEYGLDPTNADGVRRTSSREKYIAMALGNGSLNSSSGSSKKLATG